MPFVADLHVHSYLSRATSRALNLEQLHRWAQLKGIAVVGTGDFTHPRWFAELREKLVPAEPGLFALRPELASAVDAEVPEACRAPVRFLVSVETSSIYKREGKVRKVHHLIYAPDLEAAARFSTRLARIGNIEADGRPILGLDSRDLLEIVLESSPEAFLVPAHLWTPWFSALGAQSGFDAVDQCYGDLAGHVFAVETGLSSDPAMNWRLSALDRFALISNSDAHSPEKLGREANLFDCSLSYSGIREALRGPGPGFLGTLEFFPEEGKYHFDGHRKCGVVLTPEEARAGAGRCPQCGHPLTAGVMRRVVELADRPPGFRPEGARPFRSLVPLVEVLGEVLEVGPGSQRVRAAYQRLLARLGPEIALLCDVPIPDLIREGPPLLGEAVERIRAGRVVLRAGHDGEFGTVRAFEDQERRRLLAQTTFAFGAAPRPAPSRRRPAIPAPEASAGVRPAAAPPAGPIDPGQAAAVQHGPGPLLITAGPGTGKTRTLVHRIARLVESGLAAAGAVTAITFTRKAAAELKERLSARLGTAGSQVTATTFHAFGLEILRAFPAEAGLPERFEVLDEAGRQRLAAAALAQRKAGEGSPSRWMERVSWAKAHLVGPSEAEPELAAAYAAYQRALEAAGALDFDDLVSRAVRLIEASPAALAWARQRCQWLFVDEYQDVNAAQHRLLQLLAPPGANLCVVGDPDQAIYGFRGAEPAYFGQFLQDQPGAAEVVLVQNYRSPPAVVAAATAVIEPSPGRAPRPLRPLAGPPSTVEWFAGADERDEAAWIAEEIGRALGGTRMEASAAAVEGRPARPLALHDVAILVRVAAQLDPLAEALGRANLPFRRSGDEPLAARPRVAELLNEVRGLLSKEGDLGPLAAELGRLPVSDLIVRLGAPRRDDPAGRAAVDLCAALAVPFGRDVEAFLDLFPLLHETDLELEAQRVALLTLHASKGLEFPLVFIAGCEDGLLPLRLFGRPADVEEERRLLYVGLTRARERLVLTSARKRSLLGRSLENGPCPFLQHLPARWLTERTARSRRPRSRQLLLW